MKDKILESICEDSNNKISDIVSKTSINRSILYSIRMGRSWSSISKYYNIARPEKAKMFSDDQINNAAKLLAETNLSYAKIYDLTGVPSRTLRKIVNKSSKYKNLSDLYNIKRENKLKNA